MPIGSLMMEVKILMLSKNVFKKTNVKKLILKELSHIKLHVAASKEKYAALMMIVMLLEALSVQTSGKMITSRKIQCALIRPNAAKQRTTVSES